MSWGKKQIAGVSYKLGHLDPFIMDVTPKVQDAPTYKVHVSFGCPSFHEGVGERLFARPTDDGEERCFCQIRYGHSLNLRTSSVMRRMARCISAKSRITSSFGIYRE